jgi:probable F420-dependent oxidoreductase
MKVGIFASPQCTAADPGLLAVIGPACEERGLDSIWVAEHVVLFDDHESRYPYSSSGRFPSQASRLLEPFTALAFLAASTHRIRLGTGVCLVPQRNPVYTAKSVASVDWMSGGRFDFGIGVGWSAEEYAAVDAEFDRRGPRCDAYVDVMKQLWMHEVAEYSGEFYELLPCRQDPKPIQRPHPPLHFGGHSNPSLRRVADRGNGWYGYLIAPDTAAERIATLTELLHERGRKRSEITVSIAPPGRSCSEEQLAGYAAAGVDQIILPVLKTSRDDLLIELDAVSSVLKMAA